MQEEYDKEIKGKTSIKSSRNFFLFLIIAVILLTLFFMFFPKSNTSENKSSLINSCGDKTLYNQCSSIKPYLCFNGSLMEKASLCGCPNGFEIKGDSCTSIYHNSSKFVNLRYVLNGIQKNINFTVYEDMNIYSSEISREIEYFGNKTPERVDFKLNSINEETQRQFILPLSIEIQNLAQEKDMQAKIAVSVIQNIPYGFSNSEENFAGSKVNHSRYPYEVLYDNEGICGEKSQLLAFLLKELGFEVAIFYNKDENHESVGIKCPRSKSWHGLGYCFVETSGPAIISDDSITFLGGISLDSDPLVMKISDGISLSRNLEDYEDAESLEKLREKGGNLNSFDIIKLDELKKKYGLQGSYNLE